MPLDATPHEIKDGSRSPATDSGHAQLVAVAVLGVAHHHGAGPAGDLYALAAVRA